MWLRRKLLSRPCAAPINPADCGKKLAPALTMRLIQLYFLETAGIDTEPARRICQRR
jgi:hypothetical protein